MANTWTTLLDAVYPTGSLYFSTNSTSPASKFGGTWSQIQDAFIAAKGSSYITGTVAAYSGDTYMKLKQMPTHAHSATVNVGSTHTLPLYVNVLTSSAYQWGNQAYNDVDYYEMIAQGDRTDHGYWLDHQATSDELSCLLDTSARDICRLTGGGKTSLLTTILRIFGIVPPNGVPLPRKGIVLPKSHCSEGSDE